MKLLNFSVSNYRSITQAHKVTLSETTVLIGKNNEGKSNFLRALDVAMTILQQHAVFGTRGGILPPGRISRRDDSSFDWERDFPITLQSRKSSTQTVFRLEFLLEAGEIELFRKSVGSNLNGSLPIEVKIGRDNKPSIKVVDKRGRGATSLNEKSGKIADFIGKNIKFNYIPAVRTDQEAMEVVRRMLMQRMRDLESQEAYIEALKTIKQIQEPVLKALGDAIKEPLQTFLPGIKNVQVSISDDSRRSSFRNEFEIIVDDGTPTSLYYKGDGVKSLAALGLLQNNSSSIGASIIAIEEPESHLHPAAIHQINEIVKELSKSNQVVLTTHNPLFVDRSEIKSNIIINNGKATPAKNIAQIRDLLGIKASDNLTNASYVLVVEGYEDAISLKALLPYLSEPIKKAINNHLLVVEEIGGAGNLSYKLSMLNNALCIFHTFLDNDDAGRKAYQKAVADGILTLKKNTFVICNGSPDAEFEDCLNAEVYKDAIEERFGVNIDCSSFKGNKKWSDRIAASFFSQGKLWSSAIESDVKFVVAQAVKNNPANALNQHKRGSIDALVTSIEKLLVG